MKKINQLKAGILLSYMQMALEYVVAFVYTPIMLNILGRSEYGNYNYIASVVGYLSLFSCGFGSAYIRFYARTAANEHEREHNIAKLNGTFMVIFLAMGTLALITGLIMSVFSNQIFGGKLSPEEMSTAHTLMIIMVLNLFISFPASVFNSFIITKEKFAFQKLLAIVQTLLRPVVVLPLLYMGFRAVGLSIGTLIISLIIFVINACYCIFKCKMKFVFKGFDFGFVKEVAVFSSFLLIGMVVDQINWSVDKFILGKMTGTVAVAVYSVAATLNSYYKSISEYISNVFVPRVNRIIAGKEGNSVLLHLIVKLGRIQFFVLALISTGFIFFGKSFINLWVGEAYADSYYITLFLMLPVTVPEIQTTCLEALKAKNLHKFRAVLFLFIAIGNIFLSIPLCKQFGAIGCAMGTAVTVLIGNGFIINAYYYKKAEIDVLKFWREILSQVKGLIIPIVVGIIIMNTINIGSWVTLLLTGSIYVAVYVISIWKLAMNNEEKLIIKSMVKPLLKMIKK